MIHPYVQQTFTEQLLPVLCQAAGGEGRAQTSAAHSLSDDFPEETPL